MQSKYLSWGIAIACSLVVSCDDEAPAARDASAAHADAGSIDESSEPAEVPDEPVAEPSDPVDEPEVVVEPEPVPDPGPRPPLVPLDAGLLVTDAGFDGSTEAGSPPPIISAPPEVKHALCSNAYDSVKLSYTQITRGSWQFNPGGAFVKLPAPGYPCAAFREERKVRPAVGDPRWTDAADGAFLGFNEPSTITSTNYTEAQFRFFRSFIFVPMAANLKSLDVQATGIDDAVFVELINSRYPMGVSPRDVGPSDPDVGACQGNGQGQWNLAKYVAEGEINVLVVVHADLAPATSTLMSVGVNADGAAIQLVSCKN